MMKLSQSFVSALIVGPSILLLSGCLSILPEAAPASSIYRLSETGPAVTSHSQAVVVRVDVPRSSKALGSEDVVVSPDGRRLAFAQGATWSEPIPVLIQQAMLSEFGKEAGISGVRPSAVARPNYVLEMDLKAFEAEFDQGEDQAPLGIVRISVTLTDIKSRKITGRQEFSHSVRANERRVSRIVDAQDQATQVVLGEISGWVKTRTGAQSNRS